MSVTTESAAPVRPRPGVTAAEPGAWDTRPDRLCTVAVLALALVTLAIHLTLTVRRSDRALFSFDSAEYAVAGRHLADTGRLATPYSYPGLLAAAGHPPFALVAGHPLVPVLDAALFRLAGPRPALTLIPAALAFVLTVLFAAWLGRGLSGSRAVGLATGAAVALAPAMLHHGSEGLSEMPFTAALVAGFLLLAQLPDRPRPLLLGICLGLAQLTRPVMMPLLPAWLAGAWLLAPPNRRLRTLGLLLLGVVPAGVLLALYKWVATGSPSTDAGGTLLLANLTPALSFGHVVRSVSLPAPVPFVLAHPGLMLHKALREAPGLALAAVNGGGRIVGLLLLVHLVAPAPRRERVLNGVVAAMLALLVVMVAVTVPRPAYFFPLLPVVFAFALVEAWRLARTRGFGAPAAIAGVAAIVLLSSAVPTARAWRDAARGGPPDRGVFTESELVAFGDTLRARLPHGATIASDMAPWWCWYAGVTATLLPASPAELPVLNERLPLDALVITNEWMIDQPGDEPWHALWQGTASAPGWRDAGSLSAGRIRARLLVPETPRPAR